MFDRVLAPHFERVFALLRIISGLLLAFHGAQKFGLLALHPSPPVGSQVWIGGIIEVVAGLCVALGLWTTLAAFLASGTMAVAYTQFHWKLQFGKALLPMHNGGELALVYAFVFLAIACHGAGVWSLDNLRAHAANRSSAGYGASRNTEA
jgi:putative oxidoreductase